MPLGMQCVTLLCMVKAPVSDDLCDDNFSSRGGNLVLAQLTICYI